LHRREPDPLRLHWPMVKPHSTASMGDDFLPLRRYGYHVFNLMSRISKKKTRYGKAAPGHSSASVRPTVARPKVATARPPAAGSPPTDWPDRWMVPGVCILLAAMVWVVFGQTLGFGFVNLDDNTYIYDNPVVQKGLTFPGIVWAFTHVWASNWHPLTWISHMLDCQLYGLNAGGHHLTNVLLHTATVTLLFLVLRQMTGCLWRSAFVAAVFAIHPLRVESVAWLAERKDVLSGLFFMLTLGAYVNYARHPWSPARYGLVVLLFALGLMCKPMLVTLPFVLLLLDCWPLNRLQTNAGAESVFRLGRRQIPKRLIFEKLPLLGLTAASCAITIFAQTRVIQSSGNLSLPLRLGNALVAYVAYIRQMFWPADLAVFYPLTTGSVTVSKVALSLLVLAGISIVVIILRRRHPYLLTGWLWYLIMLVPVIGILQAGLQARADRYTYLPQIGLYLLLTWTAADQCARWRLRRVVLGGGAVIILVPLIFCAHAQTAYWRNSESLWTHTLACTSGNFFARYGLGNALFQEGKVDEAIAQYQKALQINPNYAETCNNLGNALLEQGKVNEAIEYLQKALQINPDNVEACGNLGNALLHQGKVDEAIEHLRKAVQINPHSANAHDILGNALLQKGNVDGAIAQYHAALQINPLYSEACYNLGNALLQQGKASEAIAQYQKALQINPNYANARNNLGTALSRQGNAAEAIAQYQKALQIQPDKVEVQNNLAWLLATGPQASLRNGNQAVALAQRANQLTGDGNPVVLDTLAAAYAEAGRFPEAVATAQRALHLAEIQSNTTLAESLQSQIKLFQAGQPFHLYRTNAPGGP
jgi:protein O-mannosyl-transferase